MGTAGRAGTSDRPVKGKDKCILLSFGKRADGTGPTYRVYAQCISDICMSVFVCIVCI